jgi:hypothetical protein
LRAEQVGERLVHLVPEFPEADGGETAGHVADEAGEALVAVLAVRVGDAGGVGVDDDEQDQPGLVAAGDGLAEGLQGRGVVDAGGRGVLDQAPVHRVADEAHVGGLDHLDRVVVELVRPDAGLGAGVVDPELGRRAPVDGDVGVEQPVIRYLWRDRGGGERQHHEEQGEGSHGRAG